MRVILAILDFLVVLAVVIGVSRAVWYGEGRSRLLSGFVIVAMMIFGLVAFSAAYGLTESSPFNQWALLIFLVAIAVVTRLSWAANLAP
jgi:hypothetical protein